MPRLAHQERDKDQERAAIAIAALLITLERKAQRSLKSYLRLPLTHLLHIGATPSQVGESMRAVGRGAILRIREGSREQSGDLWRKQTGQEFRRPPIAGGEVSRADAAAESLARQWEQEVVDALKAGTEWPDAATEAFDAFEWRSDRTATTEVVESWNDEVVELNTLARDSGFYVEETWCSLIDACPHCADLDGTSAIRPLVLPEYPPAHPRCRCFVLSYVGEV